MKCFSPVSSKKFGDVLNWLFIFSGEYERMAKLKATIQWKMKKNYTELG